MLRVLESVLKRDPNHLGANHYYVHVTEGSPNPGRALVSAKRLETLAPKAGHLIHMPAHTYERTGNYAAAAAANEAGARADREFMTKYGRENFYSSMYYNRDLEAATTDSMKVVLRFYKWTDVLRVTEGVGPFSTAFRHAARGIAFARMGDVAAAEAEQKQFETARGSLADQNMIFQNSPKAIATVAAELLSGRIAEARGDRDAAIDAYRRAVAAEDALS